MKKQLLLGAVALLGCTTINAQLNCGSIKSITLNADTSSVTTQRAAVFYLKDNGSLASGAIDTTNWHHLAFTKAADRTGNLYIDGQLVFSGPFDNNSYNYSKLYIGTSFNTTFGGFFKGWIDELKVSDTVRTSSEILASYNAGSASVADGHTIALFHFDETTGTSIANSVSGTGTLTGGASFSTGKFGNALYLDGLSGYGNGNITIPEYNITIEAWVKLDGSKGGHIVQAYGSYSTNMYTYADTKKPSYTWSTGDTTSSVTVDPSAMSSVWVNNGSCSDTIYFGGATAINNVTVHDTLVISLGSVTEVVDISKAVTTVKVYPVPASNQLTVDISDYNALSGVTLKVLNSSAVEVHNQAITSASQTIDVSSWSSGIYYLHLTNSFGTITVRKIVVNN